MEMAAILDFGLYFQIPKTSKFIGGFRSNLAQMWDKALPTIITIGFFNNFLVNGDINFWK